MVCDGNKALEAPVLTTRSSKIVTMTGVINGNFTNYNRIIWELQTCACLLTWIQLFFNICPFVEVSIYTRRCPGCHMIYRYQEWWDRVHNFNDYVLLSLELCLYLRHSLQVCLYYCAKWHIQKWKCFSKPKKLSTLHSTLSVPESHFCLQGHWYFGEPSGSEISESRHCTPCLLSFWGLNRHWLHLFLCKLWLPPPCGNHGFA